MPAVLQPQVKARQQDTIPVITLVTMIARADTKNQAVVAADTQKNITAPHQAVISVLKMKYRRNRPIRVMAHGSGIQPVKNGLVPNALVATVRLAPLTTQVVSAVIMNASEV